VTLFSFLWVEGGGFGVDTVSFAIVIVVWGLEATCYCRVFFSGGGGGDRVLFPAVWGLD
jgi:hypothetical protein